MSGKGAWFVSAWASLLIAAGPLQTDTTDRRAKAGDTIHPEKQAEPKSPPPRQRRSRKGPVAETPENPEDSVRFARLDKVIKPLLTEIARIADGDLRGTLLVATAVDGWIEVELFASRGRYVRQLHPTPRLQDLTQRLHQEMAAIGVDWRGLDWSLYRSGRSRGPGMRIVTPEDFPKAMTLAEWRDTVLAKRFRGKPVIDPDADPDEPEPVPGA